VDTIGPDQTELTQLKPISERRFWGDLKCLNTRLGSPDGWSRRQADIADCDSGRRSWGKLPVEKISKGCARQPFAAPTPVEGYNLTSEGSSSERCWSKRSNRAANHVGTFKHHNQRNNCLVDPYCELKYRAIILS
jgi:hypothetical protein